MILKNKKILIGVSGGIAAYKTCELIRALVKSDCDVQVVMTDASQHFVTPLTFETLTGHEVHNDPFGHSTKHIDLARWADCIVVSPATANTIARVAAGIADNLLTTLITAADVPVIFCPAMNVHMYLNPIFQANMAKLKSLTYHFVEADQGELACGEQGWGRLAEIAHIVDTIKCVVNEKKELKGNRVLVTAGPTEENIDPVRFLSNRSSGKMGFALAEAAAIHGADVTLISGPNSLRPFSSVEYREIRSAKQMYDEVFAHWDETDMLIMAAAVSDYTVAHVHDHKIKKSENVTSIALNRTHDILFEAGQKKGNRILVGFALETQNGLDNAKLKLHEKQLDMIVLNDATEKGAGFGNNTNRVTLIDNESHVTELPLMEKCEVAHKIIEYIIKHIKSA